MFDLFIIRLIFVVPAFFLKQWIHFGISIALKRTLRLIVVLVVLTIIAALFIMNNS